MSTNIWFLRNFRLRCLFCNLFFREHWRPRTLVDCGILQKYCGDENTFGSKLSRSQFWSKCAFVHRNRTIPVKSERSSVDPNSRWHQLQKRASTGLFDEIAGSQNLRFFFHVCTLRSRCHFRSRILPSLTYRTTKSTAGSSSNQQREWSEALLLWNFIIWNMLHPPLRALSWMADC